jgi:cytochrome P450
VIQPGVPELDLDLFDEASLRDPFEDYRRLRGAGPLVRLKQPDVFAIGRFGLLQSALRAAHVLISGEGVGFSDVFNAPKGMNVLQSDGDLHRRLRANVTRPLTPARLNEARTRLKTMVAGRIATLTGSGEFEAMAELASFLPLQAVAHLVGLPAAGRTQMLDWAGAAFNVIGPNQSEEDLAHIAEAMDFLRSCAPSQYAEGSWAAELFESADSGRLTMQEAMAAVSAYIFPSLDTTILAKGHLLFNLAQHPEQWEAVKQDPRLIPNAVLESVRHSSVLRWFSRVAAEDYAVGDLWVPKGARVMLLYGCANRDERHYSDPDRFDITRDARDHLAWGTGPHMCAGMNLARIEMEVLLEALVEQEAVLSAGSPTMGSNAGLYGFVSLPYKIE